MLGNDTRTVQTRVRGLGAAGRGTGHWWWQRVTAVALIPLLVWFLASLVAIAGRGHQALLAWLTQPWTAIALVVLVIAMFWHMALGLTVIAEDYLHHTGVKVAVIGLIQLGCISVAAAAIIAIIGLGAVGFAGA